MAAPEGQKANPTGATFCPISDFSKRAAGRTRRQGRATLHFAIARAKIFRNPLELGRYFFQKFERGRSGFCRFRARGFGALVSSRIIAPPSPKTCDKART